MKSKLISILVLIVFLGNSMSIADGILDKLPRLPKVTELLPKHINNIAESISEDAPLLFSNCTSGVNNIRLIFHSRNVNGTEARLESLGTIPVDPSLKTIFIIHGFLNDGMMDWVNETVSALLQNKPSNVFAVDWRNGACAETALKLTNLPSYGSAAANTKAVGFYIARYIERLRNVRSIRLEDVWIIGHSLGAHIAGFSGKTIYSYLSEKLGRITGLDPAGPLFKGHNSTNRLDKADANFVEITHTSILFGLQEPIGHVDFYFNGGAFQGSCLVNVPGCSHNRAIDYYIEAVRNSSCQFLGQAWSRVSGLRHTTGKGEESSTVVGPLASSSPARGTFYVETKARSPYCTGALPTSGIIVEVPLAQIGISVLDDSLFKYV